MTVGIGVPDTVDASLIQQVNLNACMIEFCARQNQKNIPASIPLPASIPRMVLRHGIGKFCKANRWHGIRRGQMKECFKNATLLAFSDPERFIYMEGYGIRPSLGIVVGDHAWVLDRERHYEVVDPTWRDTKGAAYLGIPFSFSYLRDQIFTHNFFGLLDTVWSNFPILRLPPEEWLHPDATKMAADFTVPDNLDDPTRHFREVA